jgi:hypothetical protein
MDQLFTQREGVILMQVTQVCHIYIQVTSLYFFIYKNPDGKGSNPSWKKKFVFFFIKDALLLKGY